MGIEHLFKRDLIFCEQAASTEELFISVGKKLLAKKLVKPGFIEAITEREKYFPTGLDLSVVNPDSLNVAIPHTEVDYCNGKGIVLARLKTPITFHNMIAPDKQIPVSYAFFMLNNERNNQTNMLSLLMGFFTSGDRVAELNRCETKEDMFRVITK